MVKQLLFVAMTFLNTTCNFSITKSVFGVYNSVSLGGLYSESLVLNSDSTFVFRTNTCLTAIIAVGNFNQNGKALSFYNIDNLSKPLFLDSLFLVDTLYLFPNTTKNIIKKDTALRFYGNELLSDRVPSSIIVHRNRVDMFNKEGKSHGTLERKNKQE